MKTGEFNNIGREGKKILQYIQAQHHHGAKEQFVKEYAAGRAWLDLRKIPKPVQDSFALCVKLGLIVGKGRGENRVFTLTTEGQTVLNSPEMATARVGKHVRAYQEPFESLQNVDIEQMYRPALNLFVKTAIDAISKRYHTSGLTFSAEALEQIERALKDVYGRIKHSPKALEELKDLYERGGKPGMAMLGVICWYKWSGVRGTTFENKYTELWNFCRYNSIRAKIDGKAISFDWGHGTDPEVKASAVTAAVRVPPVDTWRKAKIGDLMTWTWQLGRSVSPGTPKPYSVSISESATNGGSYTVRVWLTGPKQDAAVMKFLSKLGNLENAGAARTDRRLFEFDDVDVAFKAVRKFVKDTPSFFATTAAAAAKIDPAADKAAQVAFSEDLMNRARAVGFTDSNVYVTRPNTGSGKYFVAAYFRRLGDDKHQRDARMFRLDGKTITEYNTDTFATRGPTKSKLGVFNISKLDAELKGMFTKHEKNFGPRDTTWDLK